MNYGSTIDIRLTSHDGKRVFYSEYIILSKNGWRDLESAIDSFKNGASDAIRDILNDIEIDARVKDLNDGDLVGALRNRGYTITKNIAS